VSKKPSASVTLAWPAPTPVDPAATRERTFLIQFDLGTLDAIEEATGMGMQTLAQAFVDWDADPSLTRGGVLFRFLVGCLRSTDPRITYEQCRDAIPAGDLWRLFDKIPAAFNEFMVQLAGRGAAVDPTKGGGSGPGPSPSSELIPGPPADSPPAT
jgi:hypothetical protein